jgi:hypothetical protein
MLEMSGFSVPSNSAPRRYQSGNTIIHKEKRKKKTNTKEMLTKANVFPLSALFRWGKKHIL